MGYTSIRWIHMNALRSQNCRDQHLILLGAASALFFIVYFATESPDFAAREWWGLAVTSVFGILGGEGGC